MRQSLARFNRQEVSSRIPSLADFITLTYGFRLSVHTEAQLQEFQRFPVHAGRRGFGYRPNRLALCFDTKLGKRYVQCAVCRAVQR